MYNSLSLSLSLSRCSSRDGLPVADSGESLERDCVGSRGVPKRNDGERRLQDETSDCDSLLPTTIAPYVRSRGTASRPQRRTNGKETRRPRRCTLIVAWRCLLKNFVSHQPRRERRLHGTVEATLGGLRHEWRPALPLSCKRLSFRFVLCPR